MNKINALIITGELEVKFQENEDLKGKVSELQELIRDGNTFDVAICYGRLKETVKSCDVDVTNYMDDLYKFICNSEKELEEEAKLNMFIEDLDLSAKSSNVLKRAGKNTVQDLLEMSRGDLAQVRNMGQKSFEEITEKISKLGLHLKGE